MACSVFIAEWDDGSLVDVCSNGNTAHQEAAKVGHYEPQSAHYSNSMASSSLSTRFLRKTLAPEVKIETLSISDAAMS